MAMSLLTASFLASNLLAIRRYSYFEFVADAKFLQGVAYGWIFHAVYMTAEISTKIPGIKEAVRLDRVNVDYLLIGLNLTSDTFFLYGSLYLVSRHIKFFRSVVILAIAAVILSTIFAKHTFEGRYFIYLPGILLSSATLLTMSRAFLTIAQKEAPGKKFLRFLLSAPLVIYALLQYFYLYSVKLASQGDEVAEPQFLVNFSTFGLALACKIVHLLGVLKFSNVKSDNWHERRLQAELRREAFDKETKIIERHRHEIAAMIHEIATPIAELRLMLENLEKAVLTRSNVREKSANAQAALVTILATLNAAHTLVGRDPEQEPLDNFSDHSSEFEAHNVNTAIQSAVLAVKSRFREERKATNSKIHTSYTSKARIECRSSEIVRLFINLLRNSFDAIEERQKTKEGPGNIYIRTARKISREDLPVLEVTVSDDGEGISETNLEQVFQRGFSTRSASGRGYGLSIVERTVRDHSGVIRVKSGDFGTISTRITITLPVSQGLRKKRQESEKRDEGK